MTQSCVAVPKHRFATGHVKKRDHRIGLITGWAALCSFNPRRWRPDIKSHSGGRDGDQLRRLQVSDETYSGIISVVRRRAARTGAGQTTQRLDRLIHVNKPDVTLSALFTPIMKLSEIKPHTIEESADVTQVWLLAK